MMNAIDQWEAEEAAAQLAALRKEEAAFAALPAEERARIIKEGRDRLEAFAEVAESDEDEDEDEDEDH
jgi:acyl-CoA reductase-like NAD-dependent aldehyde dehydrogenase